MMKQMAVFAFIETRPGQTLFNAGTWKIQPMRVSRPSNNTPPPARGAKALNRFIFYSAKSRPF
jgi:hypothetical protein